MDMLMYIMDGSTNSKRNFALDIREEALRSKVRVNGFFWHFRPRDKLACFVGKLN
jgi:hypothetical protein